MMRLFIARQPVFDRHEGIFAYDLALRGPVGASGQHEEPHAEQLLAEIFLEIGIDRVADGAGVLVSVNRDMLLRGTLPMLPSDRVILQIPAAIGSDPAVTAACKELASAGYKLALHGADYTQFSPELLQMADVIKVDVGSQTADQLAETTTVLRDYRAMLLATNVRHRVERDKCAKLGFELFEGYSFSAPETFTHKEIGIEHVLTFRVLKLVRDPAATDQDIEDLLRRDVGLSYKLLRMVNSAATGARDIWSIGHALRLLGREQVARWLSVLLVTDGGGDGVRAELMQLALMRARMCELLADELKLRPARGPLFLVGMLSVLDQLLEVPMPTLCDAMELAPDIRAALLHRSDFFGTALSLVESYIGGKWTEVELGAASLGLEPSALQPMYLDALDWASSQRRSSKEPVKAAS